LATATVFFTSHDPERLWIWVYAIFASYPASLIVRVVNHQGEAVFAATLLFAGTLQWGIIGSIIDAIIHRFRRAAPSNI
jgi:hypothetical protein